MSGQRRDASAAFAAFILVTVLAGCGGSGSSHHQTETGNGGMMGGSGGMISGHQRTTPTGTSPGPTPTSPTSPNGPTPSNGRTLFLASGCGDCHTLAAAGTSGTAGPSLDQTRPSYELVVQRVTSGGGDMPPFGGSLTMAQIRAIARYVTDSTR
jgi:mono/diheme cytochrome c family protein